MRFPVMLSSLLICYISYSQKKAGDSIQLRNLERDWHNAYVQHNIKLIKNVLDDNFIDIGRYGNRITKQQVLENFIKDYDVPDL